MSNVKTENTIKRLEQELKKAPENLKPEIKAKITALKTNKEITK